MQTTTDALAEGDDAARTTLGRMRKMRPAILESELRLPKFEGYLLFPDALPVARIKLTADHLARRGKARQPGFVAGDPKTTHWQQSAQAAPPSPPSPRPSPPSPKRRGPV
nr:type IV secretion system DNA-binding domain-containing protein [Sphingopyxis terrae]